MIGRVLGLVLGVALLVGLLLLFDFGHPPTVLASHYLDGRHCYTLKGEPGVNGGGASGDATICGDGEAYSGTRGIRVKDGVVSVIQKASK